MCWQATRPWQQQKLYQRRRQSSNGTAESAEAEAQQPAGGKGAALLGRALPPGMEVLLPVAIVLCLVGFVLLYFYIRNESSVPRTAHGVGAR
mmetsp:Transcript_4769/g.13715  ORF Transcript_4769/g.13715 Transcript_4769/m.13715 type:complete len:92 (+) Transcript_4769:814-1089(+)